MFPKSTRSVQHSTSGNDEITTEVSVPAQAQSHWNSCSSSGCQSTESLRIKLPRQHEVLQFCPKVLAASSLLSSEGKFAFSSSRCELSPVHRPGMDYTHRQFAKDVLSLPKSLCFQYLVSQGQEWKLCHQAVLLWYFFIMLYFAFGFKGIFNTRRQTQWDILCVYVHYIIIKVT